MVRGFQKVKFVEATGCKKRVFQKSFALSLLTSTEHTYVKESAKKVKARLGFPFILFVSRWAQAFIIFGMCKLIRVHSMQHNAGDLFCGFDIMHGILMETIAC